MNASKRGDWSPRYTQNSNLARAHFTKLVAEAFVHLSLELPPSARNALSKQIIACFNCGSARVLVSNGKREFRVAAAAVVDDIEKYSEGEMELLVQREIEEYVEPLLFLPDMIWLNKELSTLRKIGQEVGLDWAPMNTIFREQVDMIPAARSQAASSKHREIRSVESSGAMRGGNRDPDVAARRTEIENMMRTNPRVSTQEICKRLDYRGIAVPDSWTTEGKVTWQETLKKYANRVHKIISVDRGIILNIKKV